MKRGENKPLSDEEYVLNLAKLKVDYFSGLNEANLFMPGLLEGRACRLANDALIDWLKRISIEDFLKIKQVINNKSFDSI